MRFITRISSFLLDSAVSLIGMAFVGLGVSMLDNDIKVMKKDKEAKNENSEDQH